MREIKPTHFDFDYAYNCLPFLKSVVCSIFIAILVVVMLRSKVNSRNFIASMLVKHYNDLSKNSF